MVTRIQYYEFIKKMQASECKSASAMNAADMRAYAIKLGYVQANGIATKALQARAKKPVVSTSTPKVSTPKVSKPVVSLNDRKKAIYAEIRNTEIKEGDTKAQEKVKVAKMKELREKLKALV